MQKSFERAIANVVNHGDTDIFPFPIENRLAFDKKPELIALLQAIHDDFDAAIVSRPPTNYGALAPVGYTGFRWATQIDPLWNLYFLSLVIEIGSKIEAVRLPPDRNTVFSYRFQDDDGPDLFSRSYGWRPFMEQATALAANSGFVVSSDISEFYPRLNHHRLDNALRQLPNADACRIRIMSFLSNFSETYSFGLPVGGPAARLLSELTLNQVDRLLYQRQVRFCRFADDYYLFAQTEAEAFKALVLLSEILHRNQGLQLQKSKTRIMSSAEFARTNPLARDEDPELSATPLAQSRSALLHLSLHFDPYSTNAHEDYERLKTEIRKYPILEILKSELGKSRINISLTRKLVSTLQYIDQRDLDDAARTLVDNDELLYPVYFSVLSSLKTVFGKLGPAAQRYVVDKVRRTIEDGSPIMAVDLNLQYAVRLLSCLRTEESVSLFTMLYDERSSSALRRDIILAMARWKEWVWLSDRRAFFRSMSPMERRAYIIGSFVLKDEGQHWRSHTRSEFSDLELLTRDWAAERVNRENWEIPL